MKSKMFYLILLTTIQSAHAVPTLYPDSFNASIRNNTSSRYVADSQNSNRFYVLPPGESFAEASNLYALTTNIGFCKDVAALQRYSSETLELINESKVRSAEQEKELQNLNQQISLVQSDLGKIANTYDLKDLLVLDIKISDLEKRLDDLYVTYKNCTKECALVAEDINQTERQRIELLTRRNQMAMQGVEGISLYDAKTEQLVRLQQAAKKIDLDRRETIKELAELYATFINMYDAHIKREGGRVSINYDSHWSENVMRLKQDNPQASFEKMSTKNVTVAMGGLKGESIIGFDIGGYVSNGPLSLSAFPEAFKGTAVLNLLAVCPIVHPEYFDLKNNLKVEDLKLGATVSYDYPVSMKYEVVARYNMRKMYNLVKSSGTNGGFFSSSSWSNHDESEYFKDAFSVDWSAQDEKQTLPEDRKSAIAADLRKQIFSRIASVLVMNNPAAKLVAAQAPPQTGAVVLSNSLAKICPANVYCQGASIVFNVLQAIFGSSHSSESVKQITDVESVDRYTNQQIILQPMLTTYR